MIEQLTSLWSKIPLGQQITFGYLPVFMLLASCYWRIRAYHLVQGWSIWAWEAGVQNINSSPYNIIRDIRNIYAQKLSNSDQVNIPALIDHFCSRQKIVGLPLEKIESITGTMPNLLL